MPPKSGIPPQVMNQMNKQQHELLNQMRQYNRLNEENHNRHIQEIETKYQRKIEELDQESKTRMRQMQQAYQASLNALSMKSGGNAKQVTSAMKNLLEVSPKIYDKMTEQEIINSLQQVGYTRKNELPMPDDDASLQRFNQLVEQCTAQVSWTEVN